MRWIICFHHEGELIVFCTFLLDVARKVCQVGCIVAGVGHGAVNHAAAALCQAVVKPCGVYRGNMAGLWPFLRAEMTHSCVAALRAVPPRAACPRDVGLR